MKKIIPLSVILFLWAAAISGSDLPPYAGLYGYNTFYLVEDQEEPVKEIEIFPNPVTEGRLNIKASESILSVQILNITGKMVFNEEYQPNTNSVVIDLDKPEKGIYLVRIGFAGKVTHTEKIMVK